MKKIKYIILSLLLLITPLKEMQPKGIIHKNRFETLQFITWCFLVADQIDRFLPNFKEYKFWAKGKNLFALNIKTQNYSPKGLEEFWPEKLDFYVPAQISKTIAAALDQAIDPIAAVTESFEKVAKFKKQLNQLIDLEDEEHKQIIVKYIITLIGEKIIETITNNFVINEAKSKPFKIILKSIFTTGIESLGQYARNQYFNNNELLKQQFLSIPQIALTTFITSLITEIMGGLIEFLFVKDPLKEQQEIFQKQLEVLINEKYPYFNIFPGISPNHRRNFRKFHQHK